MNHHLWWTIKVQIFSISSCACSQCRAGHLWQLLPLLPHPWPPAGVEENPVPSAAPRESCGSAGASGHLPLHVPSSQKPLWHGSVAGRDVTASIVPHYSSGMVLYTLSQGTKLQLSSNPLLQPLYFSGFSRRTNRARRGLASSTACLGPKGNLPFSLTPSCPRHHDLSKVQDSLVTSGCRWCFDSWKQSPHQPGGAAKCRLHLGAVVRKHRKGKTFSIWSVPLGFSTVSLLLTATAVMLCFCLSQMCPWAELWAQCPHRKGLPGQLPSSGLAGRSWQPWMHRNRIHPPRPPAVLCTAQAQAQWRRRV